MLGSAAGQLGGSLHNISPPFELTKGLSRSGSFWHPTIGHVKEFLIGSRSVWHPAGRVVQKHPR